MMTPPGTWVPSDRLMSAAATRRLRIASLLAPMFIVTVLVADERGGAMLHAALDLAAHVALSVAAPPAQHDFQS